MKIYWKSGIDGDFTTAADWSTGTIPVSADSVAINASGTYTVTSSSQETVLSLSTAAGATLDITGGTFTMTAGTGTGANAGTIIVDTELTVGGTINNTGVISIVASAYLNVTPLGVTLKGGGQVALSGGYFGPLGSIGSTVTNIDNTISGFGAIFPTQLINKNKGVIDATGFLELGFNVTGLGYGNVANSGILEATAGGQLYLAGTIANTGGLIQAEGAGSKVHFVADIVGGTLKTANGGELLAYSGGLFEPTLDGRTQAINNLGLITVGDNNAMNLLGTIHNYGIIELHSIGNITSLTLDATLSGGGHITLSNNEKNFIIGSSGNSTLTNVDNTIAGAGQIGGAQLTLINLSKGVIDANDNNPLIIDTGGHVITNSGRLEATSGGELFIGSSVNNSGALIANAGSLIIEGVVTGRGTATITGGGQLEFGAASAERTNFVGAGGTLVLDVSASFTGKISGFTVGDLIDLTDIGFGANTSLKYHGNAAGGILTVSDGTHTGNIALVGHYTQSNFTIANDGGGGTLISDPNPAHTISVIGVSEVHLHG